MQKSEIMLRDHFYQYNLWIFHRNLLGKNQLGSIIYHQQIDDSFFGRDYMLLQCTRHSLKLHSLYLSYTLSQQRFTRRSFTMCCILCVCWTRATRIAFSIVGIQTIGVFTSFTFAMVTYITALN